MSASQLTGLLLEFGMNFVILAGAEPKPRPESLHIQYSQPVHLTLCALQLKTPHRIPEAGPSRARAGIPAADAEHPSGPPSGVWRQGNVRFEGPCGGHPSRRKVRSPAPSQSRANGSATNHAEVSWEA